MREISIVLSIFLLLACIATVSGATLGVSGYDVDPGVFFPYDTGTVTVHIYNAGNTSGGPVGVSTPNLINPKVHVINTDIFNTMTYIGPGATVDYSFLVTVDPPDGTYFPLFTVSTNVYGEGSIHSTLKIVVDSTDIRASISKKPDTFSVSKKDTVNVSVVNPRRGDINDVLIIPEGTGIDVTPSESYVGTLKAGSSVQVPFQVTPGQQANLTFQVSYRNGDNKHTTSVSLPILIGEDKLAVVPVVNNVVVTSSGSTYTITGDVNNAGITDAKSMILTVAPPAKAVEPYAKYAIGSLASDDFSSFELTFTSSDLSLVPLVVQWKDADGNSFSITQNLDLGSTSGSTSSTRTGSSGSSGITGATAGSSAARTGGGGPAGGGSIFGFGGSRGGGISSFYPVIAGGILLIVGIVVYKKRKWLSAKLKRK